MLGYLDIDNLKGSVQRLHDTPTRSLVSADGLIGVPGSRAVVKPKPSGQGSTNRSKWLKDRVITLQGEVWGSSPEAALADLDTIQAVLFDGSHEDILVKYRRGGSGPELQQTVRLADDDVKVAPLGYNSFSYQVQLRASDPRAYSQAVYTATSVVMGATGGGPTFPMTFPAAFVPGSAGQASFTNGGPLPTPATFRLYGGLTGARVRLMPDGPDIALKSSAVIAAGHFLELDVASRAVLLDGSVNRRSLYDFAASAWFELPKGSGGLRLLADDADAGAYMTVTWRDAYGG